MKENKKQAALDYIKSIHVEYDSDPVIAYCAFGAGAEWMQKKMIDKACRCYCDDICDKGRRLFQAKRDGMFK